MAMGEYPEAAEHHRRALACYQEIDIYWLAVAPASGGAWGVPVSLHRLGDIALTTGDLQEARQYYHQGLALAVDKPFAQLKVYVLLGPARWLAQFGEVERAAELAALALHHPDSVEEVQDKARQLLAGLESQLPPDAFAAAQERGRARDLEATLAELLEQLVGGSLSPDRPSEPLQEGAC
jgi:tetratricopeptide (TPR) repeat protein